MNKIPQVMIGYIGGSGTWAFRFPEDLERDDARVLEYYRHGFETPCGQSGPAKLLDLAGHRVLRFAMHGWHEQDGRRVPPHICAKQLAWVYQQAGIKWAVVEASVGGIQAITGADLPPWSVMITSDLIYPWVPTDLDPLMTDGSFPRMRELFHPDLRRALLEAARKEPRFTVHDGGVYVHTLPGRFETPAEIAKYAKDGAHVVGQSLGNEAPLMRKLSIALATLNIVSNHAEDGREEWCPDPGDMRAFYYECAPLVGAVMFEAIVAMAEQGGVSLDQTLTRPTFPFPVEDA